MISLGATARAGLIAAMLFGAVQARAAEPAPVLNPAPTAQDWAAIAALPDWSGVWIPDIYAPTKAALQTMRPHFCRGSVLVFDELCDDIFPGETVALREVFGLNDLRIERLPTTARVSYVVL